MGRGFLESEHKRSEVGKSQPVRHDPPEHPPLLKRAVARPGAALSGDHENEPVTGALGPVQEAEEGEMGFLLAHPVQVDDAVHVLAATPQGLERAARALAMVEHGATILAQVRRRGRELEAQTSLKRGYLNLLHAKEALDRHALRVDGLALTAASDGTTPTVTVREPRS